MEGKFCDRCGRLIKANENVMDVVSTVWGLGVRPNVSYHGRRKILSICENCIPAYEEVMTSFTTEVMPRTLTATPGDLRHAMEESEENKWPAL